MPPSTRITFRLTPALEPLVAARVRQGTPLSDIVREALEQYFGLTHDVARVVVSDTTGQVSDSTQAVSDIRAAMADMQTRLAQLEARLVAPVLEEKPRPTVSDTLSDILATPGSSPALPAHIERIAAAAMEYDKLSLAELSQLLYDRAIYRASDRTTGASKPVNRGTLSKWLTMARQGGLL